MSNNALNHITGSLSDLKDIIVPKSAGFFPPAPAWFAAAVLLAFFFIRWGVRKYTAYQENRYRREAEKQLSLLEKIIQTSTDQDQRVKAAMALPVLLKQTAIAAYKREKVARLSQDQWLAFLDKKASMTSFSRESGQVLTWCAYGPSEKISAVPRESFTALAAVIRKWIRKHAKEKA